MIYLGLLIFSWFVGPSIFKTDIHFWYNYALNLLQCFGMADCKPAHY
jgi:hypothetical protein